ncbi:3944_t:CDS:1, partial [Cetraspora pellucida]
MSQLDQTINIVNNLQSKTCSYCYKHKNRIEFTRPYGGNEDAGGEESEYSNCNDCAKKKRKKSTLEVNKDNKFTSSETLNRLECYQDSDLDEIIKDDDSVLYDLDELEKLVSTHFANTEDNKVDFSKTFEFENELIDNSELLNIDQEAKARKVANFFLLPLEAGSHYYWEIRKVYIHKNNLERASVYLGCTQKEDRQYKNSPDQLPKRISEIKPPIIRFACERKITININFNLHQAKVDIQHLIPHEQLTHRKNRLPESAIAWISKHINLNLKKTEIHKRLCEKGLIDP